MFHIMRRDTEMVEEVFVSLYAIFLNYILSYDTDPVDVIFV